MKRIIRERVEELLGKRGIKTLTELHLRIQDFYPGFSWKTLSQSINDKSSPTLGTLDVIAQGLNTTVAYLIGEIADPAPAPGAGEPLPEVAEWSARLSQLGADQRAKFVQGVELLLDAFEAGNAAPR